MNEEELKRYAAIGLRADVQEKAGHVLQNMEHLKTELTKGGLVRSRYKSSIDSTVAALMALDEALAKKEGLNGDR